MLSIKIQQRAPIWSLAQLISGPRRKLTRAKKTKDQGTEMHTRNGTPKKTKKTRPLFFLHGQTTALYSALKNVPLP
jgi:hypothetical protein